MSATGTVLNDVRQRAEGAATYAVSRATSMGRRSVPPLSSRFVSAGTEPRRERPRLPPRSVTPRAAQGSFTSRFRVSGSEREVRAAACQIASRRAARSRTRGCVISSGRMTPQPCGNACVGSLVSVAAFAYAGVMYATAVVGGKVVRFKLSPALARAHRQNRGKTMTEAEAVAFVETKRRARALRRARPYLASRP